MARRPRINDPMKFAPRREREEILHTNTIRAKNFDVIKLIPLPFFMNPFRCSRDKMCTICSCFTDSIFTKDHRC